MSPPYANLLHQLDTTKFYFKTEDVERVMATAARLGIEPERFIAFAIFAMTERRFRELQAAAMLE
jgi:hypothetical protein